MRAKFLNLTTIRDYECTEESDVAGTWKRHHICGVALTQADITQWKPSDFQSDTGLLCWSAWALSKNHQFLWKVGDCRQKEAYCITMLRQWREQSRYCFNYCIKPQSKREIRRTAQVSAGTGWGWVTHIQNDGKTNRQSCERSAWSNNHPDSDCCFKCTRQTTCCILKSGLAPTLHPLTHS